MDPTDVVASALAAKGPVRAFGVCGSGRSLDLAAALNARGVPFVSVGHEAAGALMAAGASHGGMLGVSLSIKGPGLANSLPGIIHNRMERLPTMSISEAFDASTGPERQHKRADHRALVAGADVAYVDLHSVGTLGSVVDHSRAEPRRPTHLDLAVGHDAPPLERSTASAPSGAAEVEARMSAARRPVLVAGSLAVRRGWGGLLSSSRQPVLTTVAAKGIIDETGPNCAGVITGAGRELAPETVLLAKADLVVGVGLRAEEMIGPLRPDTAVVYLDEIVTSRPTEGPMRRVASAAELAELLELLQGRDWATSVVDAALAASRSALLADRWAPATVFRQLAGTLGEHTLVCDTGDFCTAAEHIWPAGPGREFITSANSRFMGSAVPMSIGYGTTQRARRVVCAVGDGGICSYPLELHHLADLRLDVCVLVLRDRQYTSVLRPRGAQRSTLVATPAHSWARFAEVLGIRGEVVHNVDALEAALLSWTDGPMLLEVALPSVAPTGLVKIR